MNNNDLLEKVSDYTGFPKNDVKLIIFSYFNLIKDSLKKKEKVSISKFGIFNVELRKAKICRNPKTGEKIKIEEKFIPKFKASEVLKKNVR